jgi:hypothetical protein
MESSHTADLDIPELNAAASKAHVFPGMANHYLLSFGQLCDKRHTFTFKQDEVTICDSGNSQFLSGPRDLNTGLWRINLRTTNNNSLIQSNEICTVSSSQRWTSDYLARLDGARYQQTFETDAGYSIGPHEPTASKYMINLEGAHWNTTNN